MCQVYFWEINESKEIELFDKLMSIVSTERRARVARFKFQIDKLLAIFSEVLDRFLASSQNGTKNGDMIFTTNENGKPYLFNSPDFYFNITHTRTAIAVATSGNEIGVDIEKIRVADIKIADRFFTSQEINYIQ